MSQTPAIVELAEQAARGLRIGATAGTVYLRIKAARWWDWALGRDPADRDMTPIHQAHLSFFRTPPVHHHHQLPIT